MAQDYENAFITVIAVDGENAYYGLRGIGGPSQNRHYRPKAFEISSSMTLASADVEEEEQSYLHKWHTRAWTFQERSIARRKLVFVNGTVYWECWTCREFEVDTHDWEKTVSMGRWPHHMVERLTFPDLRTYFKLVEGFNYRHKTRLSDAHDAFSAVLQVMSSGFPGGFHYGIPEFCFDIGMLWTASEDWPLTRRPMFPSWSWLGWSGAVELPQPLRLNAWEIDLAPYRTPVYVTPTTSWHRTTLDGRCISVDKTYSKYQAFTERPKEICAKLDISGTSQGLLPEGWTYGNGSPYQFNFNWMHVFSTPAIPNRLFKFPFPLHQAPLAQEYAKWSTHLRFRARTTSSRIKFSTTPTLNFGASLRDENGEWIGVIRFDSGAPDNSEICSLIEISRVNTTIHIGGLEEFEPDDCDWTSFRNVLLVEQINGVSYRRSVGRVPSKIWESQNLVDKERCPVIEV
jgi:hypothetical protein